MRKLKFTKMTASGNDFVVLSPTSDIRPPTLAKRLCDRKFGAGADGMLLIEKKRPDTIRMRIFNADGSEAEMCGNGARCAALYAVSRFQASSSRLAIKTMAGIIDARVHKDMVRIKLTDPRGIRLNVPIKINGRLIKVSFINTGVPHAVIFVHGLEAIGVFDIGRQVRNHREFAPAGTNADFVEIFDEKNIGIRTYERGVEDETLACGTGSVAAALVTAVLMSVYGSSCINVHTKSGEILKVYFKRQGSKFSDVWLEGKAGLVYEGEYYV